MNLKKSWFPGLLVNQERVWKAEKAAQEEKKALHQLRKEREEERQLAELQRMQEEATGKKRTEKLDWMYAAPGNNEGAMGGRMTEHELESYLLGKKRVDEVLAASDKNVGNSHNDFIAVQNANSARDTASKVREDPLLAMKKAEQAQLAALMNRPDIRRQLRDAKKEKEGKGDKEERRARRKAEKEVSFQRSDLVQDLTLQERRRDRHDRRRRYDDSPRSDYSDDDRRWPRDSRDRERERDRDSRRERSVSPRRDSRRSDRSDEKRYRDESPRANGSRDARPRSDSPRRVKEERETPRSTDSRDRRDREADSRDRRNGDSRDHRNGDSRGYSNNDTRDSRNGSSYRDDRDYGRRDDRDDRGPRRPSPERKPYESRPYSSRPPAAPSRPAPAPAANSSLDDTRAARLAAMSASADSLYAERSQTLARRAEEEKKVLESEEKARSKYHRDEAAGMFMKHQEEMSGQQSLAQSLQRRGGMGLLKDL